MLSRRLRLQENIIGFLAQNKRSARKFNNLNNGNLEVKSIYTRFRSVAIGIALYIALLRRTER